ncbi:hypothetical protein C8F01DRAFT_1371106 [Mycena amicta]|nr:hypothetical protein C8F01DRAFT_1371106 [Mycena amicta]
MMEPVLPLGATCIKSVNLSTREEDWRTVYLTEGTKSILFFRRVVASDLLAVVTYGICPEDSSMCTSDIDLVEFSSGNPHPLARCPSIHIDRLVLGRRIDANLEIVGATLGVGVIPDDQRAASKSNPEAPYIHCVSRELFEYDDVCLSNEGIIGVKLNEHSYLESLEMLHFG